MPIERCTRCELVVDRSNENRPGICCPDCKKWHCFKGAEISAEQCRVMKAMERCFWKCQECERKYRGQTGNSAQERVGQHFKDWNSKDDKCPLYRHSQLYHKGERFRVGVKILRNCFGDPTTRRISEAVLIDELTAEETMNAKSEWTYVKLNKLSMH